MYYPHQLQTVVRHRFMRGRRSERKWNDLVFGESLKAAGCLSCFVPINRLQAIRNWGNKVCFNMRLIYLNIFVNLYSHVVGSFFYSVTTENHPLGCHSHLIILWRDYY